MLFAELDLEHRIDELETRLRERLSPEDFRLVRQLRHTEELAAVAACTAWEQHYLDALIQHFPDLDLAIRGVAAHVRATAADCDTLRGLAKRRPEA